MGYLRAAEGGKSGIVANVGVWPPDGWPPCDWNGKPYVAKPHPDAPDYCYLTALDGKTFLVPESAIKKNDFRAAAKWAAVKGPK